MPEKMDMDLSQLSDFPTKLQIYVQQTQFHSSTDPAEVKIVGLDRECHFTLQQPILMIPQSFLQSETVSSSDVSDIS